MEPKQALTDDRLKTPRAAAVAGIVFSVLFIISLLLIRTVVPAESQDSGAWVAGGLKSVNFAFYLLPFAGIAFLWFLGVLRDRMGEREDRFFATVFLGSGLLFHWDRKNKYIGYKMYMNSIQADIAYKNFMNYPIKREKLSWIRDIYNH